ncbi:hypothetical protein D8Y22_16140 [Salinadaptatus halalkaliphilus]|uniref:DUF7981 domain-containing protein n=1 Tax=Salinadaptatus halalkaliphilus TaxID=2419781 RepID=A0A4S3TIR7_9EURY|nr:hypothetical protein [Salinadaptatus halalkaliphilus]THE63856.1 hypothetical protein D8Y22_16140 [Salinadaptatus halalkaliphilus]
MHPRTKSALLWGAVGVMAFLVLIQGYALVSGPLVSITQGAAVALVVGLATAGSAYVLEHRIAALAARRVADEPESHGGDGKSKS